MRLNAGSRVAASWVHFVAEHRSGTGAYACTFTYDGPGNRLTQMQADGTLTTYTYNPASELLTTQVGEAVTTFSYDPVGNTVGEQSVAGELNFTWDGENRLVEDDDGETVETCACDATGLRTHVQSIAPVGGRETGSQASSRQSLPDPTSQW